jgi:hypothetical protein
MCNLIVRALLNSPGFTKRSRALNGCKDISLPPRDTSVDTATAIRAERPIYCYSIPGRATDVLFSVAYRSGNEEQRHVYFYNFKNAFALTSPYREVNVQVYAAAKWPRHETD